MRIKSILPADSSVQFSSVAQSCPTLCDPMDYSMSGLPVHYQLPGFTQLMSIELVMPSNHLILCHLLLLLPSIFPSIRVFSNESVLCIRWPKYWSFSFSISPSNEYSGLIQVQCYKDQYCIGIWNVRSMNQGKLEVIKQEMARVNITF